jgi:cellular nucleic acid-binding protein
MSKECSQPTDWSRVKCQQCEEYGHTYKRCKQQKKVSETEDDANGGGAEDINGGGDWESGAPASGGGGEWESAPAPASSSGGW